MDFLSLALLLLCLAFLLALFSGDAVGWVREEWKRMQMKTWDPNTMEDERCQKVRVRQHQLATKLHKSGRSLLSGADYRPALTKPSEPRNAKVLPLARKLKK